MSKVRRLSLIFVDVRCIRHAFIFSLPWPAHRAKDVQEYPPAHLITNGYVAKRISSYPLPSLAKVTRKKVSEVEQIAPLPDTKEQRLARHLRAQTEKEEFIVEQLREAAWAKQEAKEIQRSAAEEARVTAKRMREEEKKKRNENKVRGTGVWSRYEYVSPEEIRRRQEARSAVTSGTRRGGRFRSDAEEEEMKILAKAKRMAEESTETVDRDGPDGDNQTEHVPDADYGYRGSTAPVNEASSELRVPPTKRRIKTYSRGSHTLSSGKADPELHPTAARKESRHSLPSYLPSSRPLNSSPVTLTPRRRGRPPGSGKWQRAAAAQAAVSDLTPINLQMRDDAPTIRSPASFGSHRVTTGGNHSQPTARVITTIDSLRDSLYASGFESIPEIESKLQSLPSLPPSNTNNSCESGLTSVDAASPGTEMIDMHSSIEDDGFGEVEGEIVDAGPDDEPSSATGLKRKRVSSDYDEEGKVLQRIILASSLRS